MILLNPKRYAPEHLDEASAELMQKTIAFFEAKGKVRLKKDDRERVWYADFLDFVAREKIFAKLLTPAAYGGGDPTVRWDTWRNCEFSEITAFYALHYWYTWQVTILGLGPIWMGTNEAAKKKAAEALKAGGIFAFGLSERAHGADLYSTEMRLQPNRDGTWTANGSKYYIGNANEAAMVSTFAKTTDTGAFVFIAADPRQKGYELVQNVVNVQSYVAEYRLHDYRVTDADILSMGDDAWDSSLNTVNVGKFNLGWASIGISTHAFYEALHHAENRVLYGKHVTEFPHVRQLLVDAYCRLVAMKAFSRRASDYMRTASAEDRRYLLFNPMVKMKVTTQGEQVIDLLWDVIAAKGFEKDTYFEIATRDIRALPKLEGTVHVNMALVVKFMRNYFFNPGKFPEIPSVMEPRNDDFLFRQGPTKGLGKIQFHDFRIAYGKVALPTVSVFKQQIGVLEEFLVASASDPDTAAKQGKDIDFLLSLGEVFTLVAYGQLLLEYRELHPEDLPDDLLEQIFDFMVRDFSKFALQLYSKPSSTPRQMELCQRMIMKPPTDAARFERVWAEVHALSDAYEMSP
ncbi:MAG: acyl-CoA dehydrogenase [Deltaproteobacteria bacterium]|nr:acyl-CoA dehydrogenase [Deltaproteobacteria bacterium]